MPYVKVTQRILVSSLGLLLLVAGCSSNSGLHDDAARSLEWENAPVRLSPLLEIIGPLWLQSEEEFERMNAQRDRLEQESIAACMREAGFEYIINLDAVTRWQGTGQIGIDDRDFVSQYGYGIVSGHNFDRIVNLERPVDPNDELVATFTEAEREAWYLALNGPLEYRFGWGVIDLNPTEWREARAKQGCAGKAAVLAENSDPRELLNTDEFLPLNEAILQFRATVFDNPLLAVIDAEWAFCMADAGHPGFEQQFEAQRSITQEWNSTDFDNQLAARGLQEREIELALADLNCRESTNYRERVNAITDAAETQFISDNQAAFNALRNAIEQRS